MADPLYVGFELRPTRADPARIDFIWRDDHLAWILDDISDLSVLVEQIVDEIRSRGDQVELVYMSSSGMDQVVFDRVSEMLRSTPARPGIRVLPLRQRRGWPQNQFQTRERERVRENVAELHREFGERSSTEVR